jgi:hypothetical protein
MVIIFWYNCHEFLKVIKKIYLFIFLGYKDKKEAKPEPPAPRPTPHLPALETNGSSSPHSFPPSMELPPLPLPHSLSPSVTPAINGVMEPPQPFPSSALSPPSFLL